jgi:uncharacterized membrane protein YhaH (DUF805 family)
MRLGWLLFVYEGRINRTKFWLAYLANAVIAGILGGAAAINAVTHTSAAIPASVLYAIVLVVYLLVAVFVLWSTLAVATKRLHDRNKSAWWLAVFYVMPLVLRGVGELAQSDKTTLLLSIAGAAVAVWGLAEMGFLRGSEGPNAFGPDPLQAELPQMAAPIVGGA